MRAPAHPSPSPPLPPAAGREGSPAPRAESVVLRGTLRGVAPAAAQRLWLRRAWKEGRGLPWPGATVAARGGHGGEGCVRIVGLGLAEETIVGVEEGTAIYKVCERGAAGRQRATPASAGGRLPDFAAV